VVHKIQDLSIETQCRQEIK